MRKSDFMSGFAAWWKSSKGNNTFLENKRLFEIY